MTAYAIRQSGADTNNGLTPATAFRTVGKFVSVAVAGDVGWIGAGCYREVVTLATSGTTGNVITLAGDADGGHTGDAGEVRLSLHQSGDALPATAGNPNVFVNGKNYWTLANLTMEAYGANIDNTTVGHDITVNDCVFLAGPLSGNARITLTATVDTALNWTLNRCSFGGLQSNTSGNGSVKITAPRSAAGVDYNLNVVIRNCRFVHGGAAAVLLLSSSAGANFGGGVLVDHGSFEALPVNAVQVQDANCSLVYPVIVTNCATGDVPGQLARATSTGQIAEDYNALGALISPRVNTLAGTADGLTAGNGAPNALVSLGEEAQYGGLIRPTATPLAGSPLAGFGNTELGVSGGSATLADDATVGAVAWTNPGNAGYPDANNATAALTVGQDTHYLKATNFSFWPAIPGNAIIDGIRVELNSSASVGALISLNGASAGAKLVKGGVIGGANRTDSANWGTGNAWTVLGSHCDLWGNTLAASDVNASTFGVAIAAHSTGTSTAQLDYVRMLVYYHLPTPTVTVDLVNRARPACGVQLHASGTATAGGAATLTDSGQAWGANALIGDVLAITSGTGAGQYKIIKSNTAAVITCYSNWATNPDATSHYIVYHAGANLSETGKATSGTASTLVVSNASWVTNMFAGDTLEITSGTGSGQRVPVLSNTATALTIGPTATAGVWTTNPDSTSVFALYTGIGGVGAIQYGIGALARHDTMVQETVQVVSGTALKQIGPGDQEWQVAVDAVPTTLSLQLCVDNAANFGAGNEPQLLLIANGLIGVAAQTVTCSSPAISTSYQTYSLAQFTPTAKGVVRVRLVNRTSALLGTLFADSWSRA